MRKRVYLPATSRLFMNIGRTMLRITAKTSPKTAARRFRAAFGVSSSVCNVLWFKLARKCPPNAQRKHMLWALLFLKLYATEHINAFLAQTDEKTFRKWCWSFVEMIAGLRIIDWHKRHKNREGKVYKASVDGTDFRIMEPVPFDSKWFSHKFKGPGLRYEIGVGIGSGEIVWANGPYPCGAYTDIKIYRIGMKKCLSSGEKVVGDGGYMDETCSAKAPLLQAQAWGYVRARHEVVNKRVKQFMIMGRRFRHALRLHSCCFHAVANLTQLMIENGEPIFQ